MKKNIIIKFFPLILLIIISCSKQNNVHKDVLKGKIKIINELSSSYDYNFYYIYDSIDGMLQKVMLDNKLFVSISKKIDDYIIIEYDASVIYTNSIQKFKLKAYLDNVGYINKIVKIDTISLVEDKIVQFYSINNFLDSIREYPSNIFKESKLYDFNFQFGNMTSLVRLYDNIFTSGIQIDTLSFFYNQTIVNKNLLPAVSYGYMGSHFIGFATIATQPLFLLSLDGYFPFNNNNKLLDSIEYKGYQNGVAKYAYTLNSLGAISKITLSGSQATFSYDIGYY